MTKLEDVYIDEEKIVEDLLREGILFVGWDDGTKGIATLYVFCSDTFVCGADGEDLPYSEIGSLQRSIKDTPHGWGATRWVALHRKLRPLPKRVEQMKADGAWDAELGALPE